jgi:micrococcal nuclease
MTVRVLMLIMFVTVAVSASAYKEMSATVISVIDGNTIDVETPSKGRQRVVLAGIDSPELTQQFGEEAKRYLEKKLLQKKVTIILAGKDPQGNNIGVVLMGDDDLRVELLKEGLAWTMENNSASELEPYKTWAKTKGRGLWKQANPTPPWVFRRQQSMLLPKSS